MLKGIFGGLSLALLLAGSMARANNDWLGYINWITEQTDYEYHGEPLPELVFYSQAYLQILVYGEDQVARSEFSGTNLPEVMGAYLHTENQMLLPEGVDLSDHMVIATVVHELVHFLQHINGVESECAGELEPEAYRLHWAYAQEHGLEVEEPSWLFVALLQMSCYDHYY